jgi:hypothetical protein
MMILFYLTLYFIAGDRPKQYEEKRARPPPPKRLGSSSRAAETALDWTA